jgi:hypothetical protein
MMRPEGIQHSFLMHAMLSKEVLMKDAIWRTIVFPYQDVLSLLFHKSFIYVLEML